MGSQYPLPRALTPLRRPRLVPILLLHMKNLYDKANVFVYEGETYERLVNHPEGMKYRIIFSDDDYDYVEDHTMIAELESFFIKGK